MLEGKRLMILGAGPFQLPAIRKAAELGCHVITVDNIPGNVGHTYGQQYVNCSTADKASVLAAAKRLKIDGICTFSSDVSLPTVAYVCNKLSLHGPTEYVAETMVNKHLFREMQKLIGIAFPSFTSAHQFQFIGVGLRNLKFPIVMKPVDASGSRGVTKVEQMDLDSCEAAFLKAQAFSRTQTVCAEEFINGQEVGGDAIIMDSKVVFIAITTKHLDGFVVTGHSLPSNIPKKAQEQLIDQINLICKKLGYFTGPLNFDAILTDQAVILVEVSARNGGNGIPAVIERATGVDVEVATILLALGERPNLPKTCEFKQSAGSWVFGSAKRGLLQSITSAENLKNKIPRIFELHYAKNIGENIEAFEHNGNFLGLVLFDCMDLKDYEVQINLLSKTMNITLFPRKDEVKIRD